MPGRAARSAALLALALLLAQAHAAALDGAGDGGAADAAAGWCADAAGGPAVRAWAALAAPTRTVLGRPDVHACATLRPPRPLEPGLAVVRSALSVAAAGPPGERDGKGEGEGEGGARLYAAQLFDCPADFWQLAGIDDQEHACVANTAALRARCNQWVLALPAGGQAGDGAAACAPPGTAFATPASLAGRVLVLRAHWRLPASAVDAAVRLPALALELGAARAPALAAAPRRSRLQRLEQRPEAAQGAPHAPALLGAFAGSGLYPPSSLSHSLQALRVPAGAGGAATAELGCAKRCTFNALGRTSPRPVNVVGVSFETFDRAAAVALRVNRGWAGRRAGAAALRQARWQEARAAGGRLVVLEQPLQLFPGDEVQWSCTYNTTGLPPGGALVGGHRAAPGAAEEQCTVVLHYWPRVAGLRGCSAALAGGPLLGASVCSSEAQDLIERAGEEGRAFPMLRAYDERSFPAAPWMGSWKATQLVLWLFVVWATLWGAHTALGRCAALGAWHRRFTQLSPGQQRNVSVYVMHLLLDTTVLLCVSRPMLETWTGLTEATGEVRTGLWALQYIVACYALELTWRRRVDAMLAVHHLGTIAVITLLAGELAPQTYRVGNCIIVLAGFALMEQPTYVALLLKRMAPPGSPALLSAARLGYVSWFAAKGLSVVIAAGMLRADWHIMPWALRANFIATWALAILVQAWSGVIQYRIYRGVLRAHKAAAWQHGAAAAKRGSGDGSDDGSRAGGGGRDPLLTPRSSEGSEGDCVAAVDDDDDDAGLLGLCRGGDGAHKPRGGGGGGGGCYDDDDCRLAADLAAFRGLSLDDSPSSGGCSPVTTGGKVVRLSLPGGSPGGGGLVESSSGGSSSAKLHRHAALQRRSKSGVLSLMEQGCGVAGTEA
ncbi:hypothetical protein HT031_000106 [Scenedesmus sp. PABB004]|nr:hypothetical protein HT031_000106 [Scenedesmus sp. PABB004]